MSCSQSSAVLANVTDTAEDTPDSLQKTLGGSEITLVGSETRTCYP